MSAPIATGDRLLFWGGVKGLWSLLVLALTTSELFGWLTGHQGSNKASVNYFPPLWLMRCGVGGQLLFAEVMMSGVLAMLGCRYVITGMATKSRRHLKHSLYYTQLQLINLAVFTITLTIIFVVCRKNIHQYVYEGLRADGFMPSDRPAEPKFFDWNTSIEEIASNANKLIAAMTLCASSTVAAMLLMIIADVKASKAMLEHTKAEWPENEVSEWPLWPTIVELNQQNAKETEPLLSWPGHRAYRLRPQYN